MVLTYYSTNLWLLPLVILTHVVWGATLVWVCSQSSRLT